jgi:hypothetical protein
MPRLPPGGERPRPAGAEGGPGIARGARRAGPGGRDLATEIVLPSRDIEAQDHAVAMYVRRVRMPDYTDRLTVRQLADVTAFVSSAYVADSAVRR